MRTMGGPGSTREWCSTVDSSSGSGAREVAGGRAARPNAAPEDGVEAARLAHQEYGLRRHAAVLEGDRHDLVALLGDPPACAPELAVLEIAQRVGGIQPVALEEGAQQLA